MKKILIICLIVGILILSGCKEDRPIGIVKEIKQISAGGFGSIDMAWVVLEDGREMVVGGNIHNLEVGIQVWTANNYRYSYRIR